MLDFYVHNSTVACLCALDSLKNVNVRTLSFEIFPTVTNIAVSPHKKYMDRYWMKIFVEFVTQSKKLDSF